jgi:hypothetical protein
MYSRTLTIFLILVIFLTTTKLILAGTKTPAQKAFGLQNTQHTNIPTMMEQFAFPAALFLWWNMPHPWEPLRKGLAKAAVEGCSV